MEFSGPKKTKIAMSDQTKGLSSGASYFKKWPTRYTSATAHSQQQNN